MPKKNGKLDYLIRPGRRDRKKIVMNGKDNKFIKPKFEKKIEFEYKFFHLIHDNYIKTIEIMNGIILL